MTDDVLANIREIYDRLAEFAPPEPIKLTQYQWDWVRTHLPKAASSGAHGWEMSPLFGVPIHIVPTVEESTPYLKAWFGWRVKGDDYFPDFTIPPSSASVAPQPEETE